MTPQEKQLLDELMQRVHGAEVGGRDPEAEALIADAIRRQPSGPYYMAQALIVQDQALRAAQAKITELEQAPPAPASGGSFLGGSGPWGQRSAGAQPGMMPQQQQPPAYAAQPSRGFGGGSFGGGGGGFLQGAMQTAAGVAGGALLFQGISSLFGGHSMFGGATPLDPAATGTDAAFDGAQPVEENITNNYGGDSQDPNATADMTQADYPVDDGGWGDDSGGGGDDMV